MTNNERVTLKDVYAIVNRIEDKIDRRFGTVDAKLEVLEEQIANNKNRISRLEVKAAFFGATAGAISAFIAGIAQSIFSNMQG